MKKIINIVSFAVVALSLSSCLKDKGFDDNKYGINPSSEDIKVINLPTPNTSATNTYLLNGAVTTYTYSTTATARTLNIPVHLSAKDVASEDITVTLGTPNSAALTTAYNNVLIYPVQPFVSTPLSGKFTFSGKATIKAGTRDAIVPITFNTPDVDPGKLFFGISITAIDKPGYVISGNQGSIYVAVLIQNEYFATYRSTATTTSGISAPVVRAAKNKSVLTVNKTTIAVEMDNLGTLGYMLLTVNPDNTVSIAPDPRGSASAKSVVASGVNVYNPTTKTFTLNYTYTTGTNTPNVVSETLVRQ